MSNISITNVDFGSVEREGGRFRDATLTFDTADTFVKGTILARRKVASAVTPAPDGANTGDGTVTNAAVAAGTVIPIAGAYILRCVEAITNGGVFQLEDPNGAIVATDLRLTVGAGATTSFEVAGLSFDVTDGGTDFAAGDFFTLTVAADGKLVPFDPAGAGGVQVPVAVLTYEVTLASGGDWAIRALIGGEVNRNRLIIDTDGDGSNITDAILDQLRDIGITPIDVQQLDQLDNQ